MNARLSRSALFQYSILALPLAFAGLPLYIHAPDFYAEQAGLSLALIGAFFYLYAFLMPSKTRLLVF